MCPLSASMSEHGPNLTPRPQAAFAWYFGSKTTHPCADACAALYSPNCSHRFSNNLLHPVSNTASKFNSYPKTSRRLQAGLCAMKCWHWLLLVGCWICRASLADAIQKAGRRTEITLKAIQGSPFRAGRSQNLSTVRQFGCMSFARALHSSLQRLIRTLNTGPCWNLRRSTGYSRISCDLGQMQKEAGVPLGMTDPVCCDRCRSWSTSSLP